MRRLPFAGPRPPLALAARPRLAKAPSPAPRRAAVLRSLEAPEAKRVDPLRFREHPSPPPSSSTHSRSRDVLRNGRRGICLDAGSRLDRPVHSAGRRAAPDAPLACAPPPTSRRTPASNVYLGPPVAIDRSVQQAE